MIRQTVYLSLDPGDTTGWASFADDGSGIGTGVVVGGPGIYELLDQHHAQVIICEDYKIRPDMATAHIWSPVETARYIGGIQHWCWQHSARLEFVSPRDKPLAYRYAGIQPAKNHRDSHDKDAYAHGVKYLQDKGIRRPQQGAAVRGM